MRNAIIIAWCSGFSVRSLCSVFGKLFWISLFVVWFFWSAFFNVYQSVAQLRIHICCWNGKAFRLMFVTSTRCPLSILVVHNSTPTACCLMLRSSHLWCSMFAFRSSCFPSCLKDHNSIFTIQCSITVWYSSFEHGSSNLSDYFEALTWVFTSQFSLTL